MTVEACLQYTQRTCSNKNSPRDIVARVVSISVRSACTDVTTLMRVHQQPPISRARVSHYNIVHYDTALS
jgi:hypothetical protein